MVLGISLLTTSVAPVASAAPDNATEVGHWDFESGTASPWELRDNSGEAELSVISDGADGSGHAITITSRGNQGDGALIDIQGADLGINPGQTVYFDAYARFEDGASGYLNMSSQHGYEFSNVIYQMPVGTDWTPISGSFVMPYFSGDDTATLYIETPWVPEGTGNIDSFSLDNITLSVGESGLPEGYLFGEWDFEDGEISPWFLRDNAEPGAEIAIVSPGANASAHGITVTDRDNQGDGPMIDVTGGSGFTIPSGQFVYFEADARFNDGTSGNLHLSSQHGENFTNVIYGMSVGSDWTPISGTFFMPGWEDGDIATLYVETPWVPGGAPGNTTPFSLDNIRLSVPAPPPQPAEGAISFGGTLPLIAASFDDGAWNNLPGLQLMDDAGWFQTRYTRDYLTVIAQVNEPADAILITYGNDEIVVMADGEVTGDAQAITQPTANGFQAIIQLPHDAPGVGQTTVFDLTAVNTSALPAGTDLSDVLRGSDIAGFVVGGWNAEGEIGSLTFAQPFAMTQAIETDTPPTIDGQVDAVWAQAQTFDIDTLAEPLSFSTGVGRTLWHGDTLYLLVEVTDDNIQTDATNWWYRDAVTIYIDLGNGRAGDYRENYDVQINVNADGEVNFGGNGMSDDFADRVTAATTRTDIGYNVEVAITLTSVDGQSLGGAGTFHGFEVQIYDNDGPGADSPRNGIRVWTDVSGDAWQNTSRWGVVELVSGEVEAAPPVVAHPETAAPAPADTGTNAWVLPVVLLSLAALAGLIWWLVRNTRRKAAVQVVDRTINN